MKEPARNRVLLIRTGRWDITPAVPRFASVLGAVLPAEDIHVLCWPYDDLSAAPARPTLAAVVHEHGIKASKRPLSKILGTATWWLRILAELRRRPHTLVQSSDPISIVPCLLARHLLDFRLVVDVRDPVASLPERQYGLATRLLQLVEEWSAHAADLVIVVEENRRRFLPKSLASSEKVLVVRNLPELDLFDAERGRVTAFDPIVVNFSGYLSWIRGAEMLMSAAASSDAIRLEVVGDSLDSALKDRLSKTPNVVVTGRVPHRDAIDRMRSAHVVALLYDPNIAINRFAAPNKLYEALMLGRPIVTCPRTPMGDLVKAHDCGYLVDYGDTTGLVAHLEEINRQPERWLEKANNARELYVREYRWSQEASRLEGAYRGLLRR